MTSEAIIVCFFAGIAAGVAAMCWFFRERLFTNHPEDQSDSEDQSCAAKIRDAQERYASERYASEIELERSPLLSIENDNVRQGLVVTDRDGQKWFTDQGISWYRLPDYKREGSNGKLTENADSTFDEFLLRAALPRSIYSLRNLIQERGGRITFVPPPESEPKPSAHPYR